VNSLAIVALFIAIAFVVQTLVIREAVRGRETDRRIWRRAAKFTAIRLAPLLAAGAALTILVDRAWWWSLLTLGLVADSMLTIWLLRRWLQTQLRMVLRPWFTQAYWNAVGAVVLLFSANQCLGAQTWSNSSMSPNIRGYHVTEELPDGTHLINAATNPWQDWPAPGTPSGGIVAETFEYIQRPRPASYTHTADRFLCNKTKFPKRWDAVVFHPPREPSFHSVKRLVGLPGERITIRDGSVWANDERLVPPARLGPIRYEGPIEPLDLFGVQRKLDDWNTVTLADDEYFVLGDNQNKSLDSRIWGPIKRDLIVGVADAIYWPHNRWRMNP
jgi:signal peptidase I